MENFWNMVYRLKVVKRWGTSANVYDESVAEHCYFVTMLAYTLAELDKKLNDTQIEMDKLIIKALYHDAFETYTAHIVSPIKHYNINMNEGSKNLKKDYRERLLRFITKRMQ